MAVSKLFDERPIWVKHSLAERLLDKGLQFGGNMLRRLLFRTAYYFSNGPFLRFWIRKGYDPRKDPESRIYQRIDFRVPPSLRGYCDTNIESRFPKHHSYQAKLRMESKLLKHRWEDICAFRVFPYKCQISLQLFELADDYIQQEIRKPSKQTTCSCATGWFSSRVLDTLRFCVAVRFLSAYPRPGAESLLKSASNRFEKSKRTQIFVKDLRLDEEGKQKVNKGNEEKNMNDVEEDDEEEEDDEIEEENAEEELDEYEALNLAGEDNDFSSQPSSCILSPITFVFIKTFFDIPRIDRDSDEKEPELASRLRLNLHMLVYSDNFYTDVVLGVVSLSGYLLLVVFTFLASCIAHPSFYEGSVEDLDILYDSSDTNSDNISKNYLQELFGSFPFSEAGASGLLDAGNSDEEYQIYEQFSDGMNSDDDGN
ncbi:hypothetical protein RJ639_032930 [Escallonia herrerae]|uniref:Transcription factor IIIC subunit 5 HTH domain-containing protein n=1 Tax=Escallonia herrerae TaxID=1293975 RepID=A0AA89BG75_9ASTE|nr:hypothetical protein RJ639_032930 [Escallonia herrerae]